MTGRFVPNEGVSFEYPMDNMDLSSCKDTAFDDRRNRVGSQIVDGVRKLASQLERRIVEVTSCSESSELGLLLTIQKRLASLAQGDVVPNEASFSAKMLTQVDLATYHLQTFLSIQQEITDLLRIRRLSKDNIKRIRFSVGDVVRHKKYGFRGVIFAWDPTPTFDVSRWDGLTDVANANEMPFYRVIPTQSDCIEAFGSPRLSRYVCEANLERCPRERSLFHVDMDPGWKRQTLEPEYTPPDDIKFKYAADLKDTVTESCLESTMVCFVSRWTTEC